MDATKLESAAQAVLEAQLVIPHSRMKILSVCMASLLLSAAPLNADGPLSATEAHVLQLDEHGQMEGFVRLDSAQSYAWTAVATLPRSATTSANKPSSSGLSHGETPVETTLSESRFPATPWPDLGGSIDALESEVSVSGTLLRPAMTLVPEPSALALGVLAAGLWAAAIRWRRH